MDTSTTDPLHATTILLTPKRQPTSGTLRQALYKFLIVKPDKMREFVKGASQARAEALLRALIDIDNDRKASEGWEAIP